MQVVNNVLQNNCVSCIAVECNVSKLIVQQLIVSFLQMIAKREEARRRREEEQLNRNIDGDNGGTYGAMSHPLDAMMEQVELERKRKAHPSLQWKGVIAPDREKGNIYSKRQKRVQVQGRSTIPTLFSICVDYLVHNFEHVDALGDIDSTIRRDICNGLVAKNKLNEQAFTVIAEPGIEALEIIDCAEITQEQLSDALQKLLPQGLRFLLLHHSGRSFGPMAVQTIASSTANSTLFAISIAGAYLLNDTDAKLLLDVSAKHLTSIEFKACPNLGPEFCRALNSNYCSQIGSGTLLLELSLEHLSLTKENLLSLSDTDAVRNLKSLSLRQIDTVDDEIVTRLLSKIGDDLEGVDLSHCHQITDESLSAIRSCNRTGALRSLQLSGLKHLTAVGLEALFTPIIPGLPCSPPMLRKVDLSSCHFEAVTDHVFDLICRASSMKRDSEGDISEHYLSSMGGLVHVNVNGSSCTDTSMERLAATSAMSLKELDVSFCCQVTDRGLGYLVSKAGSQLSKIRIWGCAQITDAFLDGHARINDSGLHVVGAWIKKGNTVSAR